MNHQFDGVRLRVELAKGILLNLMSYLDLD